MVSLLHFHLLSILLTGFAVFSTDAYLRKYIPLIIGLHKHYKTSSVSVVLPYSNEQTDAKDSTLAYALTREFSRKGVWSFIINSTETLKQIKKDDQREVRPLVIVVLTTVEDINRFFINKGSHDISNPIWLVIFTDKFNASICDYCNKPTKRLFGLRFDTEMLIVCCKNKSLQEWWSLNGNRTESMVIGEWSVKDGLTSITNQKLYERRSKINGVGFRVGYVTTSAFYEEKNGEPAGLFHSILMELAHVMNFTITRIVKKKKFGQWNSKEEKWSGVMGLVVEDQIDLGVGEFSMSDSRLGVAEFILPSTNTSRLCYFKAVDSSAVEWSAHFKAFASEIWITLIILLMTLPILVSLMKIIIQGNWLGNIISEHYLNVWGMFCQQGLAVFPVETPLRIAYCSIFISSLVVSAAYSACFISFITVSKTTVPFASLKDFADDGTYDLTVLMHSSEWNLFHTSTDPVVAKMKVLLKPSNELPQTVSEGFDEVCKGKVAFCLSELKATMGMNHFPCKTAHIVMGSIGTFTMILKAGNQYTGIINYYAQRFEGNGILHSLKQRYLPRPQKPDILPKEVTLRSVAPIFSILAGGMALSLIVMLGERCARNSMKSRKMAKIKTSIPFNCQRAYK